VKEEFSKNLPVEQTGKKRINRKGVIKIIFKDLPVRQTGKKAHGVRRTDEINCLAILKSNSK